MKESEINTRDNGSTDDAKTETVAVDLAQELRQWAVQGKKDQSLRVVAGGPGSGKSSFCKKFAADYAAELRSAGVTTLFIPLHHFKPLDDLQNAVGEYLKATQFLAYNPLADDSSDNCVLLIFDGLDELSNQGHVGAEVARSFVQNVKETLSRLNAMKTRLRVLLTGSELIIQANDASFRQPGCILKAQPYYISEKIYNLHDPQSLLEQDQRQLWWQKYGDASGRGYEGLPPELDNDQLNEITAQPLLNYLVALSRDREKIEFTENTSLNAVYEDLVDAVYERAWDNRRREAYTGKLEQKQFFLILEEIALTAWHGSGWQTTLSTIESRCDESGFGQWLAPFKKGSETGVTRLLVAFFFRPADLDGAVTEPAFEFTHKSFGEYLTARRIVRLIKKVHKERAARQEDPTEGWDEITSLVQWAKVTYPTRIDSYLFQFLIREVAHQSRSKEEAWEWQQTLAELFVHATIYSTAMEQIGGLSYVEMRDGSRDAEETLLAALNACARYTEKRSPTAWPEDKNTAFGEWCSRVRGQRKSMGNTIALFAMSWLDLECKRLPIQDFFNVKLTNSNLKNIELNLAILQYADLQGASLQNANFSIRRPPKRKFPKSKSPKRKTSKRKTSKRKFPKSNPSRHRPSIRRPSTRKSSAHKSSKCRLSRRGPSRCKTSRCSTQEISTITISTPTNHWHPKMD